MRNAFQTALVSVVLAGTPLSFAATVGAQPKPTPTSAKPSTKPAVNNGAALRENYARRATVVVSEIRSSLWSLLADFQRLETLFAQQEKSSNPRSRTPSPAAEELQAVQASVTEKIARLRPQLKRLKSLTPVPQSLKKADNDFVDAAIELESALDAMTTTVARLA